MHFPLEPHHVTCWAFIPVVGPESQSLVPTTMPAKTGRDLQKKKKKQNKKKTYSSDYNYFSWL